MYKKIAIVTGAVKGIGKSIGKQLSNDGFFIIIVDIDETGANKIIETIGKDGSQFFRCDICNAEDVTKLYEMVFETYGRIDVVVNNAGIIRDNMIWKMSKEDFDFVVDVNLKGTWMMCKEAAKIMREQKFGKIINIASRAWLGNNRGQSNYTASKAGIVGLTRVLALELGKYNVNVNDLV